MTNEAGNSVTEINPSNGSWIATLRSTRCGFNRPTAITLSGPNLFIANAAGSVSELRASNGAFVRVISGRHYRFVNPVAIEADGSMILVLNKDGAAPVDRSRKSEEVLVPFFAQFQALLTRSIVPWRWPCPVPTFLSPTKATTP